MATMTNAQRDALPIGAFGYPEKRLFPVTDQEDLDRAVGLIDSIPEDARNNVKQRLAVIAKSLNLRVPKEWESPALAGTFSCEFSLEGDPIKTEDGWVTRETDCFFECGDYQDKGITVTPEEYLVAAREAKPVPIDVAHVPTIFDNLIGTFKAGTLGPDGKKCRGQSRMPEWLDKYVIKKLGKVPLSAKWNPKTKQLEKVSLVVSPRIEGASLTAAFAEAVANGETTMALPADAPVNGNGTAHGKDLLNQLKDMVTAELGSADPATTNPKFIKFLQGVSDDIDKFLGAADSSNGSGGGSGGTGASAVDANAGAMSRDPEVVKLREELATERKAREAARMGAFAAEGSAFASSLVHQFKIAPSEKDNVAACYTQAAIDDDRNPDGIGAFADGKKLSRVARFRADKEALPVREDLRGRTTDQLPGNAGQFSLNTGSPPNEIEKARLQAEAHAKRVNERRGRKTG